MGILSRFKDIMSANINSWLDKMEDPEKMIDQYLRNLNEDLAEVKKETASVMAEVKRAQRAYDECAEMVEKLQKYAEAAIMKGNDADAKAFLTEKAEKAAAMDNLAKSLEVAKELGIKKVDSMKKDELVYKILDEQAIVSASKKAAANKVKAATNTQLSWRFNLATSSTKYFQLWQGSQSAVWASVTAINSVTANTGFAIGWTNNKSDKPFKGTIKNINFTAGGSTDGSFDAYQRIKGGSTVQGFAWSPTHKFYPLVNAS